MARLRVPFAFLAFALAAAGFPAAAQITAKEAVEAGGAKAPARP